MEINTIVQSDALEFTQSLDSESINCVVTSPPYWGLRDYGDDNQLGLEPTFQEYLEKLWTLFAEIRRVLVKDGTCWVNLGDSYGTQSGNMRNPRPSKEVFTKTPIIQPTGVHKSLCMIPARFAIGMIDNGWILRNQIIWYKRSCMPSSAKDRFTVDFEKIFFFVKSPKYYFEQQFEQSIDPESLRGRRPRNAPSMASVDLKNCQVAGKIDQNGKLNDVGRVYAQRNKRTTWDITAKGFSEAHFAVYPEELVETPIKAGCPVGGLVYDPFMGSGTTALVAHKLERNWIGSELNPDYIEIANRRLAPHLNQKRLFA